MIRFTVGDRLLLHSARKGNSFVVRTLLLLGTDANCRDKRMGTPLFYAAANGHVKILELLLSADADATAVDKRGNTALCYALKTRTPTPEVVKRLIESGALKKQSERGPVLLCVESIGSPQVYIEMLLQEGLDMNAADTQGHTPLIQFAYNGNITGVAVLLKHGASVNATTVEGKTALSEAVAQGYDRIVQLLLDADADPNVRIAGRSLVEIAAEERKEYEEVNNPVLPGAYSRIIDLLSRSENPSR
jgi:ankyrin repeat protein